MIARGKHVTILPHAVDGMGCERPPIRPSVVLDVLELPDTDSGRLATAWLRNRTILVYYDEYEEQIEVRSVSATRRRLAP